MPAAKIKLISSDWRYCDVEVAAGREKGGVRARRNGEMHVTDFGGFDGFWWLG
jgi:hypothetical protein